ncbi:hypothetical protein AQUCO_04000121v1 [Aquilegia coerulea]|uniref:Uncharacterized protein n=1 Tax=Aquilegia coerulea TaxID=218851 RepID=A0A2G5CRL3_AQUCA|nr:hypothetical protein AQUCO_04000121v1 [Aquilegia coerulea]
MLPFVIDFSKLLSTTISLFLSALPLAWCWLINNFWMQEIGAISNCQSLHYCLYSNKVHRNTLVVYC